MTSWSWNTRADSCVRYIVLGCVIVASAACTNVGPAGLYGLRGNSPTGVRAVSVGERIAAAARSAATQPETWLPLAGAAVLSIGSLDENLADWASNKRPLFGADASKRSDDLRDFTTLSYFAAAAFAPSRGTSARLGGMAVGVGTMLLEGGITEGLKSISSRQRPNGRGDRSFPSGHAAQASSRATLTLRTLQHYELSPWQRRLTQAGYIGTAGAAAWARVEADKHYPTDVLVGYALGSFLANFAHNLLVTDVNLSLAVVPLRDGAQLRVSMPLP